LPVIIIKTNAIYETRFPLAGRPLIPIGLLTRHISDDLGAALRTPVILFHDWKLILRYEATVWLYAHQRFEGHRFHLGILH